MAVRSATRKGVQVRGRVERKQRPLWVRWAKRIAAFTVLLVMAGASVFGVMFMIAMRDAQETLKALHSTIGVIQTGKPTQIIARDGKTVLYEASEERREPVTYDQIPKRIIWATLAAEDKRFMDHRGVDYIALARVAFLAARDREVGQGGSTLTMQMSKRLFTSTEKTFNRKLKDIALALQMEKQLTKQEILRLYLNQVFYGHGAFGIKAAARVYFDKNLEQLSIAEAATLARIVRRPTTDNPFKDQKRALENRDIVLKIMREENWLTEEKYRAALAEKLRLAPKKFGSGEKISSSHYFVRYILDYVRKDIPDVDVTRGGYRIETTLDPDLQVRSEKHVRDFVRKYRRSGITTAAFVVIDGEGQILAMVGGPDFKKNEYNAVTQGMRQPGSSFKPFVYAAALSTGAISPGDRISNETFTYRDVSTGKIWSPKNSDGSRGGSYSVRDAIAWSKNIPAVRVTEKVGPTTVIQYARDVFGFTAEFEPVLSLGLGSRAVNPLEMAQAYSVFMLNGARATPFGVSRVIAPDQTVVKAYGPDIRPNMLDSMVAGQMDEYLRAVVTSGTGKRAAIVKDARGKTGTTQDNRDAWFCGYTNNLVGIGWIASERYDPKRNPPWYYAPMPRVFGGTYTVELWRNVMVDAQKIRGAGDARERKKLERDVDVDVIQNTPEDRTQPAIVDNVNPDNQQMPGAPTDREAETPNIDPNQAPPTPTQEPAREDPPREQPRREEPRREEPQTEPEEEVTAVEVCADTGLRATIYCPETVTRYYRPGRAPRRGCRRHGPH